MRAAVQGRLRTGYDWARRWRSLVRRRVTGIDTVDEVRGRWRSEPSGTRSLHRILPEDEVAPDDVFVDFGSGKGAVLLQAARYPFKRVVGVEIEPAHGEVAAANLARADARRRTGEVELVTADVERFPAPDDLTIAYFYNPFGGEAFRRVVERLVESARRRPRRIRVIYRYPKHEGVLLEHGFRRRRRRRGLTPGSVTCLYELEA